MSPSDNNLVHQVMLGIASADPNHLQTIELNNTGQLPGRLDRMFCAKRRIGR
jgi:hypothetical protein